MFNNPTAIVADSHGNLFVWDQNNYRIREIASDMTVTTFAGGAKNNQMSGVGTNINFQLTINTSAYLAIDRNDTLWLASYGQSTNGLFYGCNLYKITTNAVATFVTLQSIEPGGICIDSAGNIYISDWYSEKIWRYDVNGILAVFAGSGNIGSADGNGIFTSFYLPEAVAVDAANNIYVWDSGNYKIRRINQNRDVVTLTGGSSTSADGQNPSFNSVFGMTMDSSGNLILMCGSSVRKMSIATNAVTLAGHFTQTGYTNGAGNLARFNGASGGGLPNAAGVCISSGTIYVADSSNQRIRSITNNPAAQILSPANLQLGTYAGLQITGIVGRTYQIQTSPDLNSWSTKATILLNSSPYLWIDQSPVASNKFYRALLSP